MTFHIKNEVNYIHRFLLLLSILFIPIHPSQCSVANLQPTPVGPDQADTAKLVIPDLPLDHYRFWLKNHPRAFQGYKQICSDILSNPQLANDIESFKAIHKNLSIENQFYLDNLNYGQHVLSKICSQIELTPKSCWGYENSCEDIYLMPECQVSNREQEKKSEWFNQADFGYILERRKEVNKLCVPEKSSNDSIRSSLQCTKYFKTCRGVNLLMKFPKSIPSQANQLGSPRRPSTPKFGKGDVGGWNCDLQKKRIPEEGGQNGSLQSWFSELENYDKLAEVSCDRTIDGLAIFVKLDSPFNMYHYFCTFLNLYATLHLNNEFSNNNQIIIWNDELPKGNLEPMWEVFSRNPPKSLEEFEGRRICFKKFIFAFPPRMIEGLYYGTPLVPHCSKTGLFHAFNRHVLHKFNVIQQYDIDYHKRDDNQLIRVVIVSRSNMKNRNLLNEADLKIALEKKSKQFNVEIIDFAKFNIKFQVDRAQNTDILIGIHGSGLTNTLFLPDWAVLFELHDCGEQTYHDLARLRGVSYSSLRNMDEVVEKNKVEDEEERNRLAKMKLLDNPKFSNYTVKNLGEFMINFERSVEIVRENRSRYFQNLAKADTRSAPEVSEKSTVNSHNEL